MQKISSKNGYFLCWNDQKSWFLIFSKNMQINFSSQNYSVQKIMRPYFSTLCRKSKHDISHIFLHVYVLRKLVQLPTQWQYSQTIITAGHGCWSWMQMMAAGHVCRSCLQVMPALSNCEHVLIEKKILKEMGNWVLHLRL